MNIYQQLSKLAPNPVPHSLLASRFKNYSNPNEKIHELLRKGELKPLKRGLYMVAPELGFGEPCRELVANHLTGPSYISLEYALAFYGLIPEKVFEVTSVTPKRTKRFENPMGVFTYTHVPLPYYSYGIRSVQVADRQFCMMASPEKALCDKIVTTSLLLFRSRKETIAFLSEDLRIEHTDLASLDLSVIEGWLPQGPKKRSLEWLVKTIRTL